MLPSLLKGSQHRGALTLLKLTCLTLFALLASTTAFAQIDPDDTGEGVRLGMSQAHNSGQPGIVTLLARGASHTLVVAQVAATPRDGGESARIVRSPACRGAGRIPAFPLGPAAAGRFRALVPLSTARLLSGNYIVEVLARPGGARVSCGELHH